MYEQTLKYKYFNVVHQGESDTGKTQVYHVESARGGLLGVIGWYGPWRAYCFFPMNGTVWSVGCLNDINAAIDEITKRKAAIAKAVTQ